MKKTAATKSFTLTAADLQIVKGAASGPVIVPPVPKNDWTRTGYGEIGSPSAPGYDPRDCD